MKKPDIQLGPGDTLPVTVMTVLDPDKPDGSPGDPANLQNGDLSFKTVVVKHQIRGGGSAWVTRTPAILQSSPTVNRGMIAIDWMTTGGPVVPPASDHILRAIVVDNTGRQATYPNGQDLQLPDGTNKAFLWLQVSQDFVG